MSLFKTVAKIIKILNCKWFWRNNTQLLKKINVMEEMRYIGMHPYWGKILYISELNNLIQLPKSYFSCSIYICIIEGFSLSQEIWPLTNAKQKWTLKLHTWCPLHVYHFYFYLFVIYLYKFIRWHENYVMCHDMKRIISKVIL